jgi:putative FmdB family regulatory protein
MPIYEYVCLSCDHEFEELVRSMSAADTVRCPACKSGKVTRKLSVFAARQGEAKPSGMPAGPPCSECCNPGGPCPY